MYSPRKTVQANKEQAARIVNKYFKGWRSWLKHVRPVESDVEDNIYFITVDFFSAEAEWQVRQIGGVLTPCFFEFNKGKISYNICYPDQINTELYESLKDISNKGINKFQTGGNI
jgi:GH15 family glucan-1,4-alpha-glucosidase